MNKPFGEHPHTVRACTHHHCFIVDQLMASIVYLETFGNMDHRYGSVKRVKANLISPEFCWCPLMSRLNGTVSQTVFTPSFVWMSDGGSSWRVFIQPWLARNTDGCLSTKHSSFIAPPLPMKFAQVKSLNALQRDGWCSGCCGRNNGAKVHKVGCDSAVFCWICCSPSRKSYMILRNGNNTSLNEQ